MPNNTVVEAPKRTEAETDSSDWEAAVGVAERRVRPRVDEAPFIYWGLAEPHWQGQPCYLLEESAPSGQERLVIMACGCRASVPWWTLEPRR